MSNAVQRRAPTADEKVAQAGPMAAALKKLPVVLVATALALAARWAVDPWLGDRHEFLPVYLAIAGATWLAAWQAGTLVAVLFFLLAESLFGTPRSAADTFQSHALLATLSYALISAILVAAVHLGARAHRRLNDRLRQLDEADHRKSDFIALLAHELRNPLSVLCADTALIRQGKLDARALDGAWQALERQTAHMKRIVGDLLDTARVEQGKLAIARETVNIGALVTQAVADAETFTAAKRQRLVLSVAGDTGCVSADPQRIRQVLDNLLHNASKFSPEGSAIRIDVSALPREVSIAVRDSGIGIAAEDLGSLFQSFVQVEPGAGQTQGLGLGLALCRKLVELHGGTIEAHSEGKGCGSEFVLRLPRSAALAAPVAPRLSQTAPAGAPAAATTGTQASSTPRVLVVDDNADAADSLAMLLEMVGQAPVVAYSGRSALDLARSEHPRIVFMDLRLPDITATALVAGLRDGVAVRPALIGMSGLPPEESGAPPDLAAFMLKPFDADAIRGALAAAEQALGATK